MRLRIAAALDDYGDHTLAVVVRRFADEAHQLSCTYFDLSGAEHGTN